jgi:hypothetical protein
MVVTVVVPPAPPKLTSGIVNVGGVNAPPAPEPPVPAGPLPPAPPGCTLPPEPDGGVTEPRAQPTRVQTASTITRSIRPGPVALVARIGITPARAVAHFALEACFIRFLQARPSPVGKHYHRVIRRCPAGPNLSRKLARDLPALDQTGVFGRNHEGAELPRGRRGAQLFPLLARGQRFLGHATVLELAGQGA